MIVRRALDWIPIASVAIAAAALATVPASGRDVTLTVLAESAKALGCVGMLAAALSFDRGDYLRRGWGLSAICYALLLARDAWIHLDPAPPGPLTAAGRSLLVALGNGCDVFGAWTLARAWTVAGLESPVSPQARRAVLGAAVAASLLFAGPAAVYDVVRTVQGDWDGAWNLASDLGDIFALPVIAPVALTAVAVSGGSLRGPWMLLAVSLFAWLLYDGILVVPVLLGVDETPFVPPAEVVRFLAGASAFAAGLSQRQAVREIESATE